MLPLQGRGHRFESDTVHMIKYRVIISFINREVPTETFEFEGKTEEHHDWIIFYHRVISKNLERTKILRKVKRSEVLYYQLEDLAVTEG